MPIVMYMTWNGVTADQYDALRKEVNVDDDPPAGGVYHVVAVTPEGLRVTDVWESAEELNAFVGTRLMPAVKALGLPGEPKIEVLPAHSIFHPAYRKI